jgi:hypothetical protein
MVIGAAIGRDRRTSRRDMRSMGREWDDGRDGRIGCGIGRKSMGQDNSLARVMMG